MKRRNLVVERYVREAVHKIMLQVVEDELKQSEKQRRDVETKLEQQEVRFHQLVENARDVIYRFRVKPVLGCEYVSPRITDLLGYTPEELYADYKLLLRAVHPVDRERLQKSFKGKGQFHERATLRWVHKDGSLVWIERVNVPLYDEKVFKNDHAYYADHVQKKFPEDHWLGENGIESYLAIPVYDPEGKPFGHLGVMHDGPMHDDLPRESILRNFAARASAELKRLHTQAR